MKRLAAASALFALWSSTSCLGAVDLGGTNASDDAGQGAENNGGITGEGGDAGDEVGGSGGTSSSGAGAGGAGSGGTGGTTSGVGGAGASSAGNGFGGGGAGVGAAGMGFSGAGGSPQCVGLPCTACGEFGNPDVVETCVLASDGTLLTTSFDASVTVVSVTEVDVATVGDACAGTGVTLSSGTSMHVVVEAEDQRRWTLVLRMPELTRDFAMPGEPFELSVLVTPGFILADFPDQTIQLRRGTELVLFGAVATWAGIRGLDGSGVTVVDDGGLCLGPEMLCRSIHQITIVSMGTSDLAFIPYQTMLLGAFSVTVGNAFEPDRSTGSCDFGEVRQVAGIRVPP